MNTGVHGRSAVSASRRLRVTTSVGRTSFATSQSHPSANRDASWSMLGPGHGGSGASCSVRTAAPAAPTPRATRSTFPERGQVPDPGGQPARAPAASATGSPALAPGPSRSPRPRRRCASGQHRSSGTCRRRAASPDRCSRGRPRPAPRRPSSRATRRSGCIGYGTSKPRGLVLYLKPEDGRGDRLARRQR